MVLSLPYFFFLGTKNSFHIVTLFLPISLLQHNLKVICKIIQPLYCFCCESQPNAGGVWSGISQAGVSGGLTNFSPAALNVTNTCPCCDRLTGLLRHCYPYFRVFRGTMRSASHLQTIICNSEQGSICHMGHSGDGGSFSLPGTKKANPSQHLFASS